MLRGRLLQSALVGLTITALPALAGCDYHQALRPTTQRAVSAPAAAAVSLASIGYDNVTLSVAIDVQNPSSRPLTFHPERVRLRIGDESAEPRADSQAGGVSPGVAIRGIAAGARVGGRRGLAIAAASVVAAGLEPIVLVALDEATRGPHTSATQRLGPGQRARYTLQFPVEMEGDAFLVPADGGAAPDRAVPLRAGCELSLEDSLVTDDVPLRLAGLALLDVNDPHYGFHAPELPPAVFFVRGGGGPGFGHTEGVAALELGAGPRWGRTALAFTASLGFGFPVSVEMRHRWLDTGAFHATATFGHAVWFFPGGVSQGLRGGLEFGLKLPRKVFGWAYQDWSVGAYARGGPVLHPGQPGGQLDFGFVIGEF